MTSREVAELTGKRHDNVIRDIENLLKDISSEMSNGFKSTTYKDASNREYRMFEMDHDSSVCLVTGYDVNARMKVIKRWQELEQNVPATSKLGAAYDEFEGALKFALIFQLCKTFAY